MLRLYRSYNFAGARVIRVPGRTYCVQAEYRRSLATGMSAVPRSSCITRTLTTRRSTSLQSHTVASRKDHFGGAPVTRVPGRMPRVQIKHKNTPAERTPPRQNGQRHCMTTPSPCFACLSQRLLRRRTRNTSARQIILCASGVHGSS